MILIFLSGFLLGIVFFLGLWFTVRLVFKSNKPGLIFLISWIVRTAAVIIGFYLLGGNQMERIVLCLAGFIIARFVVQFVVKRLFSEQLPGPLKEEKI